MNEYLIAIIALISSVFVIALYVIYSKLCDSRDYINELERRLCDRFDSSINSSLNSSKAFMDSINQTLSSMIKVSNSQDEALKSLVEEKLHRMQISTSQQLDQMRMIVEEKLHIALENKLATSFKLVSDNLEQVHKGLGEMQNLAANVGDLKKIFANVKTRGIWGEAQLESILDQILTSSQYLKNVQIKENSQDRVEFALKLPGHTIDSFVLLAIDSKFPLQPYEELLDGLEASDIDKISAAKKALEAAMKQQAKQISTKYINHPTTVEFAILFLPIEGLYAEVLKIPGLIDGIQNELRVIVTCPSTLAALLSSLQTGYRAIAIERRSEEVWKLLGIIKTEFFRFASMLAKTKERLEQASKAIEGVESKSNSITKKLSSIEHIHAVEDIKEAS